MPEPKPPSSRRPNSKVIAFVVVLSFICAAVLSILASVLKEPQEEAKELDRSKEMLIAARILNHQGYFQIKDKEGKYVPAKIGPNGIIEEGSSDHPATSKEILSVYQRRLAPRLLTPDHELKTFEELGINPTDYLREYKKMGYYKQPNKLLYVISPSNDQEKEPVGYVIPVNGLGLWDAIYGYLAVETDGDTIIGISWYEHKETPGLGANIADEEWQKHFFGKKIFRPPSSGELDASTAQLGIEVVKGKVSEVYPEGNKAANAVDGMAGATLTGNGVTKAYREVLKAYRPFFEKLNKEKK